jgi:hypothetical protein
VPRLEERHDRLDDERVEKWSACGPEKNFSVVVLKSTFPNHAENSNRKGYEHYEL